MPDDTQTRIKSILSDFIAELDSRLNTTHEVEDTLSRSKSLTSADVGQRPETFTENYLIYQLLDALGLEYEEQPYGEAGDRVVWPDFEIKGLSVNVIGENKPINHVDEAETEIKDYLDRKSIDADYGIITDGVEWVIYKIELGGDITEYPEVARINLRPAFHTIARDDGVHGSASVSEPADVDEIVSEYLDVFEKENLEHLLSETAPREIRDERKRDVDEFYELYIELLFGESDEYDYETSLMDDIRAPSGSSKRDKRLFAITLMNRLLFIKFLETRGILRDGFLRQRVSEYESHKSSLVGNLYESQIKPLFYKILNVPKAERDPKYQDEDAWFTDVEYLNGGLFRENVDRESDYTVVDRILPTIISDLIEGSELELNGGGFDPRVLGSVFEKTINHIEQERTQKDIGAYYTPNDVTELVIRRSVDPKIKSKLIDSFVDAAASDEEEASFLRSNMEEKDLAEILRRIENGEGMYGTPEAIEESLSALSNLTLLDPACGSGHFLTSGMDEIYRAQESLLRGLNRGENPDPQSRYETKRDLALHSVYGVDVDPVAVEIAKLRIWLKIVEGNSWEPEYGKLPNIDMNISDGNSLIGLPIKGMVESMQIWNEDIEKYATMRDQYKYEDVGDPRDIDAFYQEEIQPQLDSSFLDRLNHTIETEIETPAEWDRVVNSIESGAMYPIIESIKVRRDDRESFTEDDIVLLENAGFAVYKKSARLDIQEIESGLKKEDIERPVKEVLADKLRNILTQHFEFAEVSRQPLRTDIDEILGRPFHWPVEFPEVAVKDGTEHSIHFDLVLGNPPYGDILSESEDVLTATYTMAESDIAAPFVERQLQLLTEEGSFGNVTTAKLLYKAQMSDMQEVWRDYLDTTRVAAFGKRPSKVFSGAEVRVSIISGKKDKDSIGNIRTSEFIRFDNEKDRDRRFRDIPDRPIDGFTLRQDGIGGEGKHIAIPKIGLEHIENVLEKLKDQPSDCLIKEREVDTDTENVIWRREGGDYFINPMREELYNAREVKPFYFETELEANTAFLAISSSIFYIYWTVFGDMFHLNLGEVRAFPLPPIDVLRRYEDEIEDISARLWEVMEDGFDPESETFQNYDRQKPIIEEADALLGEIYGLSDETIDFVQNYHSEYGRHGPDDETIDSF
ncbi:type II restriction enzyme, methylase subunits [Halodesulfurarchaeum formicicum]|uniref:site-specific DNA-methyltransferase (adenine-specific) n=1 Tax=Halodesulfurarchaeum formicicum TaxID=1873524 RepID=A0A1D8S429_9EURY|nr:N-6 DNA methylase [Halodesulfurarchaeum formicicum]AOW80119.1 type II restriction enzyme, methylase subunits [Halodesulfurarchaeum formicicum]